ncbi:MAG: SoxR reducing system RseC family protein [Rikenellaceae bacterium]
MASKNFSHSGKVLSIEGKYIRVGFQTSGACGGCSARSKCGMVDSSTREVLVALREGESYSIGDNVEVAISYQIGVMSVIVAYIIPLIILIGTLSGAIFFNVEEGVAALISLATVAIYYVVVYLCRSKLDKQIKFTIEN